MTKRLAALFILGLSIAAVADCGRKGPLELPPGRAPMAVERLTAVPNDGAVVLAWTNPVKTVAGDPLGPLGAVEIWVFENDRPAAGTALTPETVEKKARLARRIEAPAAVAASFTFEPVPGGAKSLAFTVRVIDRKGRASEFSALAVADILRPPAGAGLPEREGP
jgi:predicted small lipoprotein YifL